MIWKRGESQSGESTYVVCVEQGLAAPPPLSAGCRTSRKVRRRLGEACPLERVADRGWIPAAAALGGRDAIGVESVRDRVQAAASLPVRA
jgi:hypothetical protein